MSIEQLTGQPSLANARLTANERHSELSTLGPLQLGFELS
jgi:hypothetical protein